MEEKKTTLFALSWPIYIELVFIMFLGVADTLMLSQYSDVSVATVGNAQRVSSLFIVILNVSAVGVGVVVSQYLGARDVFQAKKAMKTGIFGNVLVALLLVIVLQIFGGLIFRIVNTDADIFESSLFYLRVISLGFLFLAVTQASGAGFKAFGHPKVVMYIVGAMNLMNVFLNYLLIFGIGPFPELGVEGAAYATFLSKGFAFLATLFFLWKYLRIQPFFLKFKPLKKYYVKIMKIGLPGAGEHFVYQFSQVVILSFLNTIGTLALTTQVYVQNMMMPVMIFSLAVAQGNHVIIGWRVGAREYDAAYIRTIKTFRVALVFVLIASTLMYLNSEWLLGIFTDNASIIAMGRRALLIGVFLEVGRMSNLVVIHALRASGDVIYPVVIAIFSMLLVMIGFSYFFGLTLELGLVGIFIGLASDEILRGILVFIRWVKGSWREKRVVG
ncbi:MAG: MATE family efflux transporter [Bacillota bacterium]